MVYGYGFMVTGFWFMVYGLWFLIDDVSSWLRERIGRA